MRDARTGFANGMSARDARTGCAHRMYAPKARTGCTSRPLGSRRRVSNVSVFRPSFAPDRASMRSTARVLCARGWGGAKLRRTAHSHLGPLRGSAHPLLHPSLLPRPRVLLPLAPVPVVNFQCAWAPRRAALVPSPGLISAVSGVQGQGPDGRLLQPLGQV